MIISIFISVILLFLLFLCSDLFRIEKFFFNKRIKKGIYFFQIIDSKLSFKSNLNLINSILYYFLILQVLITLFSTNLLNPKFIYLISWFFLILFFLFFLYKLISFLFFTFKKKIYVSPYFPINFLFIVILFIFFLLLFFSSSYGSDENFYITLSTYFKNGIYMSGNNIYNYAGSYFFYASLSISHESVVPFFTFFGPFLQISIILLFIKEIILCFFPKKFLSFFIFLSFFFLLIAQFLFYLSYFRSQNNIFFQVSIIGMIYFFVNKKELYLKILSFYGILSFLSVTGILLILPFVGGYLLFRLLTKINEISKNLVILLNLVFLVLILIFFKNTNSILFSLFSALYLLNIVFQKLFYLRIQYLFRLFDNKILFSKLFNNNIFSSKKRHKYIYLVYLLLSYLLTITFLILNFFIGYLSVDLIYIIISFISLTTLLFFSLIPFFINKKIWDLNLYILLISLVGAACLIILKYFFPSDISSGYRIEFSVFMLYQSFIAELIVIFIYILYFINCLKEINFITYLKKLKMNFGFKKLKNLFLCSIVFVLQIGIFISSYQPIKPAIFDFSRQKIISFNDNVFKNINLLLPNDINYLNSLNTSLNLNKTFFTDIQSQSYLIPYLNNITWIFNMIPDFYKKFGFNPQGTHHYMSLTLSFGYSTPNDKLINILNAITTIANGLTNEEISNDNSVNNISYQSPDYFIFRKDSRYFFISDTENIKISISESKVSYKTDFESKDMIVFKKTTT